MKAKKGKHFPIVGGNIADECPVCSSVIVGIGHNRGICPSCAREEIIALRKEVARLHIVDKEKVRKELHEKVNKWFSEQPQRPIAQFMLETMWQYIESAPKSVQADETNCTCKDGYGSVLDVGNCGRCGKPFRRNANR